MPFSHVISQGIQRGSDSVSKSYTKTGDTENNIDVDLVSTTQPTEVTYTLTASMLASIFMNAAYQVEMRTNSTGSPGNTLTHKSDKPTVWTSDMGYTNPFTTNVTKLYFYNTSGTTANFKLYSLADGTP